MKKNRIGVAASAVSVLGSLAAAVPAQAATLPTCAATDAELKAFNDATRANINTFVLADSKYVAALKALNAAKAVQKTAQATYDAAKTTANAAALKTAKLKVAELATALAAVKTEVAGTLIGKLLVSRYTGSATPIAVTEPTLNNQQWRWGTYTAKVLTQNGKIFSLCVTADETNAKNSLGTLASPPQKATSAETYIDPTLSAISDAVFLAAPKQDARTGFLTGAVTPALWTSRLKAVIESVGGTWSPVLGAGSGASYTVQGYYKSISAALLKTPFVG